MRHKGEPMRRSGDDISDAEAREMYQALKNGAYIEDVKDRYNVTGQAIGKAFKRLRLKVRNVERKPPAKYNNAPITDEEIRKAMELRKQGYTWEAIGYKLGKKGATLHTNMRRRENSNG